MNGRSTTVALLALALLGGGAASQELRITVNVPAYRMDVYRGDEKIRTYPVAVGSPAHPTPLGAYTIRYIEWNPWWNPPNSKWARNERRTPPGPGNPMGRAKLEFTPLYYLHGSRQPLRRAVSHGCIRLSNEDVQDLARLVAAEAGARISAGEIAALESNSKRTRRVTVPEPVTVRVVYRLTEEIDGKVQVYDDIYGMGMTQAELAMKERAGRSAARRAGASEPRRAAESASRPAASRPPPGS
jgi:murein L,D-transpeptidase YcbB/YkuD